MKLIKKRHLHYCMLYMVQQGLKENDLLTRWDDEEMYEGVRNKLKVLPAHASKEVQIVEVGSFYTLRIHDMLSESKNAALAALWLMLVFFRINGFEIRTTNRELLIVSRIMANNEFTECRLSAWLATKISERAL